jgi:hypothetical protein
MLEHHSIQHSDLFREREALTCELLERGFTVKQVSLVLNCSQQYVRQVEERLRESRAE